MRIPLFSKIFRSRASPKNSMWGSAYTFFFGTTSSGKTVNERTAMQTTAVYACVRVLAEAIASLPLHTYRYTDKGKEKAQDHNLYYLLHSEPNPEMTSFVFRETLMGHSACSCLPVPGCRLPRATRFACPPHSPASGSGEIDNLITTDELHGICDEKISKIIEDILSENISGDGNTIWYSKYHYSLNG
ncbi:MAG TPA: phage portal protein [Firmicutes bacterium]|nr:phage portal protein [Bacillota bacterium]